MQRLIFCVLTVAVLSSVRIANYTLTPFILVGGFLPLLTGRFRALNDPSVRRSLLAAVGAEVVVVYSSRHTFDGLKSVTFALWPAAIASALIGARVIANGGLPRRVHAVISGVQLGSIAFYLTVGTDNSNGGFANEWKYGLALPCTYIALSLTGSSQRRRPAIAAMVAISVLSVSQDYRSHAAVCLITATLFACCPAHADGKATAVRRRSAARWLAALAGVGATAFAAYMLVASGLLSRAASEKLAEQVNLVNPNPLFAGRVELPMSLAAVGAHPWLGWGANTRLDASTLSTAYEYAQGMRYLDPLAISRMWFDQTGAATPHSLFFSAWVEAGILGAVLMAIVVVQCIRAIASFLRGQTGTQVALLYLAVQTIWDEFFSPFSFNEVALLGAFLAINFINQERPRGEGIGGHSHNRTPNAEARYSEREVAGRRRSRDHRSDGHCRV